VSLRFLPALVAAVILAAGGARDVQVTPKPAVASPVPPLSTHSVAGEVTYVDPALRILAVRESVASASQKGQRPVRRIVKLVLTPETKLLRGRTPVLPEELRVKDYVVVRYADTPHGAVALSLRAADVVARTAPSAAGTPQPPEIAAAEPGQN